LNETGRRQAARNGKVLKALNLPLADIDFISSPLSRAIETMEIIRATMGLALNDYVCDPELLELNYGPWEGHLAQALRTTDPAGVEAKAKDPFGWRPHGGESYADLAERISAWIAARERNTIAITHGGVSRVARGCVLNLDTRDVPSLAAPQDRVLILSNDTMSWL
jgi:broad specificity phosphatase PhoE